MGSQNRDILAWLFRAPQGKGGAERGVGDAVSVVIRLFVVLTGTWAIRASAANAWNSHVDHSMRSVECCLFSRVLKLLCAPPSCLT